MELESLTLKRGVWQAGAAGGTVTRVWDMFLKLQAGNQPPLLKPAATLGLEKFG